MLTIYKNRVPFFSVIMPTYNRARLIERALQSLLAQTEKDWELIIVDDGSTDNTNELIRRFIADNPQCAMRYSYHSNRGTGLSRNAGLMQACGLYVTFLDSDDEYEPEHLAIRRSIILDYPDIDLLHGGVNVIGNPFVKDKNNPEKSIHLDECVIGGTFVIKRSTALALGGFAALRYADDSEFYERCSQQGYSIGKTDAPTYIYHRETADSLCSTYSADTD
ncbi:MAG TPA: glycosyltransferase family A protein [Candidatus Kapabacteria bacterium]|nr:glycosyltransferase family A protein [Candidatus Kapabacteria bacterium]